MTHGHGLVSLIRQVLFCERVFQRRFELIPGEALTHTINVLQLSKEYLWGFPLGQRLRDIRVKGYYMKGKNTGARRRQLDALGFNWEPKRGRPRGKD